MLRRERAHYTFRAELLTQQLIINAIIFTAFSARLLVRNSFSRKQRGERGKRDGLLLAELIKPIFGVYMLTVDK